MSDKSNYLRFLPPILWENEPPPGEFSLGAMLRIFEKILAGIDDGVEIVHTDPTLPNRTHVPIAETIQHLHRLYDPWTTPPEFLPWLASWVALEFPALWSEVQRRKVTSEIVQIYQQRGLKRGLDDYLDLYAVSDKRPRVAVDEGGRVLCARPEPGRFVAIDTLIGHGPVARRDDTLVYGGLVRPQCIALAPDGTLIVGDAGTPSYWKVTVKEAVWALPPPGRYTFAGQPPQPVPLGPSPWDAANPGAPVFPKAVAVDAMSPWRVYVLDNVLFSGQTTLYRLPSPTFTPVDKVATKAQLGLNTPVAMAFDNNGHLLILDRGNGVNPPKIVDVQISPFATVDHVLSKVMEPLSITVLSSGASGGDIVVGDGREQNAPTPADLVLIQRPGAVWTETRLLMGMAAGTNPLVAPVGVAEAGSNALLVLDSGLKPVVPSPADPFNREIAEPGALYRVLRGGGTPTIARASEFKSLVTPRGMVFDGKDAYVCDSGEPEVAGFTPRVARALPHEFSVVVHFSKQRPATSLERRRILGNISDIVDRGKPAQTLWTMMSSA